MLQVTGNRHWRPFVYRYDVPKAVLESDFDYHDPEETTDGYFEYRGAWYHLDQFERYVPDGLEGDWHGFAADSFFSGVAIQVSDDGEEYRVATVISLG